MAHITWQYVAGFFDGEGSVSTSPGRGASRHVVSLSQSGEIGRSVLSDIKEFLATEGIHINLHRLQWRDKQVVWNISLCARHKVVQFLKSVLPFARVKKVVVQDTLRFCTMYPHMPMRWNENAREQISLIHDRCEQKRLERLPELLKLRATGLSMKLIAEKLGWNVTTLYKDLKKTETTNGSQK